MTEEIHVKELLYEAIIRTGLEGGALDDDGLDRVKAAVRDVLSDYVPEFPVEDVDISADGSVVNMSIPLSSLIPWWPER